MEKKEQMAILLALVKKDLAEMEEQLEYIGQKIKQTQYYWAGESGEVFRSEAEAVKEDVGMVIKQLVTCFNELKVEKE